MKPEIHSYNFNVGNYGVQGIDKESLFVSRVESILNAEHVQWPVAKKIFEQQNKPGAKIASEPAVSDSIDINDKPPA